MKQLFVFLILSLVLIIGTMPVNVMAANHNSMFRGMHQTKSATATLPASASVKESLPVIVVTHPQAFYDPLHKINQHYQKAVRHIAQSSLSQPVRRLLITQANESRNLAIRQAQEQFELRTRHLCQRIPFQCELRQDKKTRKLLKKIDKM